MPDPDVAGRVRYLVTGGLGCIGSNIARKLIAAGHKVTVIDSCEEKRNSWLGHQLAALGAKIHKARIETSPDLTARLVEGVDYVIHAAASTGIPYSVTDPLDDWERNVDGTRTLLNAVKVSPRPTVILSSIKPYRVEPLPVGGLTEETPLEPDEPYAASKAAQSMLAMSYAKSYGLPVVTYRCSNLYGPAPSHGPRHGWLTWFCISAAIGRPIEVQGFGDQSRDMLHSDDVARACMLALDRAQELAGEVFNIGGGQANRVTVKRAAEKLREATDVEIKSGPARAMDDTHVFVNYGKALRILGWRPLVNVEDGIRGVLEWAIANRAELTRLYADV